MSVARATARRPNRSRTVAKLPRERLAELRVRSGLSVRDLAKMIWATDSPGSYHRYERADTQRDRPIPIETATRLLQAFVGRGSPPITADEVMALTDVKRLPKSVVADYFTPPPQRGARPALMIRYRIEPGVYIRPGAEQNGEPASICASWMYGIARQFVAVVRAKVGFGYRSGDELHCVDPVEFSEPALVGRKAVIAVPYKGNDLFEVGLKELHATDEQRPRVLGVVIGSYRQE